MVKHDPEQDNQHLDTETLSAYLDGEITDEGTGRAIQRHLTHCEACRREMAELRAVVGLLSSLPEPEPPRSFRLSPDMVPLRLSAARPWYIRFQPVFQWSAAAAAVLLVLVLGADVILHQPGGTQESAAVTLEAPAPVVTAGGGAAAVTQATPGAETTGAANAAQDARTTSGSAAADSATPEAAEPLSQAIPTTEAQAAATEEPADQPVSTWRLVELALALLVLWSLVVIAVLPRLRGRPA